MTLRDALFAAAMALALTVPMRAQACALELVLAFDVSGSIDQQEFALQMGGLASAFEDETLIDAISSLDGGMLVALTHWSGISRQRVMIDWKKLQEPAEIAAYAAQVRRSGRAWRNFSTAIGEAIAHARQVSASAPEVCDRRVIDVSGDGVSNEGRAPAPVSQALALEGYTINGLVIRGADPDPMPQYIDEVIAGDGAFVEVADGFKDYPRAILRKLLREIDAPMIVANPTPPR
ncbi:MAG: DUF1194 domain-containing protein [Pseudomonadota bacterium]